MSKQCIYKKVKPEADLRPYVESIWIQKCPAQPQEKFIPTCIVPNTTVDLVLNFGDPFALVTTRGLSILPDLHVKGQLTQPLAVQSTGKTGLIIVSFFPWGASKIFKVDQDEMLNQLVDLAELVPIHLAVQLCDEVKNAPDNEKRITIVEAFLRNCMRDVTLDTAILRAIQMINRQNGLVSIDDLARELFISRRQFARKFNQKIGLSPKQFARVIRFQKAMFLRKFGDSWQTVAEICGYYDQAHFIKEIREFTGLTPAGLITDRRETNLTRRFNRYSNMSHFYNTVYL